MTFSIEKTTNFSKIVELQAVQHEVVIYKSFEALPTFVGYVTKLLPQRPEVLKSSKPKNYI